MFRKWALKALTEQRIPYRVAYSSPSTTGVLAAVKAGLAVAPVGASIPTGGYRILPEGVLGRLPSAVVSLHQADRVAGKALSLLSQYIADAFRSMPVAVAQPEPETGSA
jgi:DNA-binding transcriptional LysR family regulator